MNREPSPESRPPGDRPPAHLVGICGAGMRALAEILLDLGWSLSGSDLQPPTAGVQQLIHRGLVFSLGHAAQNVPETAEILIYSPAIPASNIERQVAAARHLPQRSYSQAVGELMKRSTGVCIAGTHGKSTTTAMTASILDHSNRLAAAVVGAEVIDHSRNGWIGQGSYFVAESCEYQQSFLDYHPHYSLILSVEPDHFDCYADLTSLKNAFLDFASLTNPDGILLFNADSPVSSEIAAHACTTARRVSFGTSRSADWRAAQIEAVSTGIRFQLLHQSQHVMDVDLPLYGQHNAWNALAAAALCREIGISAEEIQWSLAHFHGIRRRLEQVNDLDGILYLDDYAHHPTAVRVTLQGVRSLAGSRRILCVFQPHQILRTTVLLSEFASSFADADQVYIAPVFAARETVSDQPLSITEQLAAGISAAGVPAQSYSSLDQIVNTLEDARRPGDVIVTMGAGDIDRIHYEFTRRVQ